MDVAIIGAGWAGLSAAAHLHDLGHHVEVFEAGHTLGGRARAVYSPGLQQTIDNGQHILLGAYSQTLALIETLWQKQGDGAGPISDRHETEGKARGTPLLRLPLTLQAANNRTAMTVRRLPAPFHLLGALLTARGYSWSERLNIIRTVRRLKARRWSTPAGLSVAQWLETEHQASHTIRHFWEPVCLAALNTPISQACAKVFATVLRDSLGGAAHHSDVLIPRVDLSNLWPALIPGAIVVHPGTPVRRIERSGTGCLVNGQMFDATIIATNVPSARRLLSGLPVTGEAAGSFGHPDSQEAGDYIRQLDAFQYIPLATLTLRLKTIWPLPAPMLMLADAPEKKWFGQWLFNRDLIMHAEAQTGTTLINVVISDASRLHGYSTEEIASGITEQLREQAHIHGPMPDVDGYELIIEKRATFACTPDLVRPAIQTPWAGILVAGDWTDPEYPAVLEGAVRSGKRAALLVDQGRVCP